MMDPYEFERKLVHEEIMSSEGITGNILKKEDVMKPLMDIPADRTYFKILDYEIRGHGDLEEFLKDLNECKDAQHRWNELKVFLMKYRREKTPQYTIGGDGNVRSTDVQRYCVAMSITDVLAKMEELEKEDGR